ncbi:MAG: carboxypeptidase-like regulatory domain-containing protein, partial [Gemmatimonadota bacterium]|nr:carboxypeptidase-like regulatory domain-containing protein [Gemmatimonadota bacterium]
APQRGRALVGVVTDTLGAPLPFAFITEVRGRKSAVADDSGRFRIEGLNGRLSFNVRRIGYRPELFTTDLSGDSAVSVIFPGA